MYAEYSEVAMRPQHKLVISRYSAYQIISTAKLGTRMGSSRLGSCGLFGGEAIFNET
jgi:hypothetical protein